MALQVTVDLKVKTCSRCASIYAVPDWVEYSRCPMCAGRRIDELESRRETMERREISLRGVITRMRRRIAK